MLEFGNLDASLASGDLGNAAFITLRSFPTGAELATFFIPELASFTFPADFAFSFFFGFLVAGFRALFAGFALFNGEDRAVGSPRTRPARSSRNIEERPPRAFRHRLAEILGFFRQRANSLALGATFIGFVPCGERIGTC